MQTLQQNVAKQKHLTNSEAGWNLLLKVVRISAFFFHSISLYSLTIYFLLISLKFFKKSLTGACFDSQALQGCRHSGTSQRAEKGIPREEEKEREGVFPFFYVKSDASLKKTLALSQLEKY